MNRKSIKILLGIIFCLVLFFLILYSQDIFGVSANYLEQDARKSQQIDSEWEVAKSVDDELGALLFYDQVNNEHVYSLYIKRDGLYFGYFFIAGGNDAKIPDYVREFRCGTKGTALVSMNKDKVKLIELDNGNEVTKIEVDPRKPFAVIIPVNPGSVKLYNTSNELVSVSSTDILK